MPHASMPQGERSMTSRKPGLFVRLGSGLHDAVAHLKWKGWQFCGRVRLLTWTLRHWAQWQWKKWNGLRAGTLRPGTPRYTLRPSLLALEERALPGETVTS